jgi:hypothetical protein
MHASVPDYVSPSSGFRCEERRRVELDRGKKRLEKNANYEKPTEQAAPSLFEVAKTYCPLNNFQWDCAKEGRQ